MGYASHKVLYHYRANSKPANVEPNPKYKPPLIPHALCTTVFLSNSSFVRTEDKSTKRTETNDVKIDVYFNGALCGSHYVPWRYSGEAYAMTEHIVRFTGRRIGRLFEKPWVIVPSGQTPDGSLREHRRGKVAYAGARQRWNDISGSLFAEADRLGRNRKGDRPVLGEYLESLAQLSMPLEVESMQKAGSPKFGVLDVVVIWGKGTKNGPDTPYILEPTSFRNEGYTTVNLDQTMNRVPVQNLTTITYSPKKRPQLALPSATPVKRLRSHYYDVLTTKQTLCEEIDSIAAAAVAASDTKTGDKPVILTSARTTRNTNTSTVGSSPLGSAPEMRENTPAQTRVVKLKWPTSTDPAQSPSAMPSQATQDEEADSKSRTPLEVRIAASKGRVQGQTQSSPESLDRAFVTPSLSADCGITYAPGGVVRDVTAARGGRFKERGVIMGARFVVGG